MLVFVIGPFLDVFIVCGPISIFDATLALEVTFYKSFGHSNKIGYNFPFICRSQIGYSWEGDTKCGYNEESASADAASNFISI